MNLKEFFKLTTLKLAMFFIILIVSFLGGMLAEMHCDPYGCNFGLLENAMIFIGFIPSALAMITNTSLIGFLIFDLIYSYILSCVLSIFIIFVYRKFKK